MKLTNSCLHYKTIVNLDLKAIWYGILVTALTFLFGCETNKQNHFRELRTEMFANHFNMNPPENWQKKLWPIAVNSRFKEGSFQFLAKFTNTRFQGYSCYSRSADDPWLIVELSQFKKDKDTESEYIAMYNRKGAYIEILMSGNLCDSYEILDVFLSKEGIKGFQTTQGLGGVTVNGIINEPWKLHP